jgi:type II secretory pathway component HofQ
MKIERIGRRVEGAGYGTQMEGRPATGRVLNAGGRRQEAGGRSKKTPRKERDRALHAYRVENDQSYRQHLDETEEKNRLRVEANRAGNGPRAICRRLKALSKLWYVCRGKRVLKKGRAV